MFNYKSEKAVLPFLFQTKKVSNIMAITHKYACQGSLRHWHSDSDMNSWVVCTNA